MAKMNVNPEMEVKTYMLNAAAVLLTQSRFKINYSFFFLLQSYEFATLFLLTLCISHENRFAH